VHQIVNRRVAATVILVVWALVMGLHIRREYFKPLAARLEARARSFAPGTYFYVVRMNGQAIGFAQTRLDTVATGFRFSDRITLDVPAAGTLHSATAITAINLSKSLALERFEFGLMSEVGNFRVNGSMRADGAIDLDLNAGGKAQKTTLPNDSLLLLDAAVPMRIAAADGLEVGRTFSVRVLDPSSLGVRESEIRVTARDTIVVPDSARVENGVWIASSTDTIPVWRLEQRFGSIVIGNWVDEDGQLVRAESALGYTLERTAFELADQEFKRARRDGSIAEGYGPIIEQTAIASNVDLSKSVYSDRMFIRLLNVDLEGFDLSGGRQQLRGDTLIITRERGFQTRPGYQLPYTGNMVPRETLEPAPLIQSDDPDIVEQAQRIAGNQRNPAEVARLLNEWVYNELDKDITLSVPSALQVLDAKQGDCNEHTVLYVALARALGLPARTAVGLVHVRGSFYYHAWPEVWLGNAWVAVDPTLGQYPADAAHLRFLVGGLARQVELIRLIGRLGLEVL